MPHCDDDELAVIALGETPRAEDAEHLADCVQCRRQVEELTAVVATARTVTSDDLPQAPPAGVWDAITDDLAPSASVTEIAPRQERARRTQPWLVAVAAAVLGVVLGGAGVALLMGQETTANLVAQADLEPVDYDGITGTATVESTGAGATLTVSVPDLPAADADGYYEVWMATPDTTTMVAIGTLNAGETETYSLPAGMSATDFPVVDVSLEHFDGDAGHSATSVVRGTLT